MYTSNKHPVATITNILKLIDNNEITAKSDEYHQALASKISNLQKPLFQITLCELSHIIHQLDLEHEY